MFRGQPPQGKLYPITEYFQRSLLALREMDVTVSSVKIRYLDIGNKIPCTNSVLVEISFLEMASQYTFSAICGEIKTLEH